MDRQDVGKPVELYLPITLQNCGRTHLVLLDLRIHWQKLVDGWALRAWSATTAAISRIVRPAIEAIPSSISNLREHTQDKMLLQVWVVFEPY